MRDSSIDGGWVYQEFDSGKSKMLNLRPCLTILRINLKISVARASQLFVKLEILPAIQSKYLLQRLNLKKSFRIAG